MTAHKTTNKQITVKHCDICGRFCDKDGRCPKVTRCDEGWSHD